MKSVIAILGLIAISQAAILCPKNACDTVRCAQPVAEECAANGGQIKVKGGWCGCCDLCVSQLGEGDDCTATMLLGAPRTAECQDGLFCDFNTRKCSRPTCAMKKKELEEQVAKLPMKPLGLEIPKCDVDGSYSGKQCRGSQCYCVDSVGNDIGYMHNRWESDDAVLCQCARDFDAYKKKGIIGRLFHCTNMGDYETVQCHGSVCYCADRKTGKQLLGSGVHISAKDTLKC